MRHIVETSRSRALLLARGRSTPVRRLEPAATGASTAHRRQPTILLAPGLREVPDYRKVVADPPPAKIPDGFTAIFNGKDLTGWHVSKTARHGVQPDYHVAHGMILGTQRPLGSGGLLHHRQEVPQLRALSWR